MPNTIQIFCALLLTTFVFACTDRTLSKEDQLKQYIDRGVAAVESRNQSDLADLVDEAYQDHKALNKPQLIKLLQAYFFRHKNIFLLTKIREISFPGEDEALVTIHVAMAGSVIADASVLSGLRARIYKFELELIKRKDWQLIAASWQPASLKDMQ